MKKRILWIDVIRIIGMISVIMIHIIGNTLNTFHLSGPEGLVFNVISKILYFSIPLFIMLSGAMFLAKNKTIDYKTILSKYALKIFLAIIIFGTIFSLLELLFIYKTISFSFIPMIFIKIISGNTWDHMWYLYLILGLYLITPILKKITNNISKQEYIYFLIILYLFTILIPELSSIFSINIAFSIPLQPFLLLYFYGHFIITYDFSKLYKYISYILGIISLLLIIYLIINNKYLNLINYTSTLTFLISNAIIILLKNKDFKIKEPLERLTNSLGTCSFGIYIIHQFFINLIFKLFKIDIILTYPYISLIIYSLVVLILSYLTIYILKKSKLISKYLI